jgi:ATP-dependent RNA helicase RhlE
MIEKFTDYKWTKQLLKAIDEQGLVHPTPIQSAAFGPAFSGKDIVGIAQTGTGKTLAYLLPVLRDLPFSQQKTPRVLIVVPTRELVEQVVEEIEKLTQFISIRTVPIYGGKNINTQKQIVHEGCDIVVATPGRLYDLALTGVLKLKDIQKLVIDECDEMLSLGFKPQLMNILALLPEKRQNFMFSATISSEVDQIADTYFQWTEKILIAAAGETHDHITQVAYELPNYYSKYNFLRHWMANTPSKNRIMIFVKSKHTADLLFEDLEKDYPGYFGVIHSNKSQNFRNRMVEELKSDVISGIIATDVFARGIDVEQVSHVINFDLPEQAELYLHRIGRTGRKGLQGTAISLVTPKEEDLLRMIKTYLKQSITAQELPSMDLISDQLLPEEEEIDIHAAPTILQANHSIGSGGMFTKSTKAVKVNIKPKQRKEQKKRRNRKKR